MAGAAGSVSKECPEFRRNLERAFAGLLNGKPWIMSLSDGAQSVKFAQFGRFEGVLNLPTQAVVKGVSVKVLDGSAVRAVQSINKQPPIRSLIAHGSHIEGNVR